MDCVPTFEERIRPRSLFLGIPDRVFYPFGLIAAIAALIAYLGTGYPVLDGFFVGAAIVSVGYSIRLFFEGKELMLKPLRKKGAALFKRPSFTLSRSYRPFYDAYCWRYPINQNILLHHDGAMSVVFEWQGQYREFSGLQELNGLVKHYNTFLNQLKVPIVLENHFNRYQDDGLIDGYLRCGKMMNTEHTPEFVKVIRQTHADHLKGQGYNNRVFGVLSIEPSHDFSVRNVFLGKIKAPWSKAKHSDAIKKLEEAIRQARLYLPEFKLASIERYYEYAGYLASPYQKTPPYSDRMPFSRQVGFAKPTWSEQYQCLKGEGGYMRPVLLYKYPLLDPAWFMNIARLRVNVDVVQIIQALHTSGELKKMEQEAETKEVTAPEGNRHEILEEIIDAKSFSVYARANKLPIVNNLYVVTFHAREEDIERMLEVFNTWESQIKQDEGGIWYDASLQKALYLYRNVGMGRYAEAVMRKDHGNTVATMLPDMIYDSGDPEPECLRQAHNGQLYGFSPSKGSILGELVAAQTGGGKDNETGMRLIESYQKIIYFFMEEGNSYQGVTEGLGGKYIEAIKIPINPLPSYQDYHVALEREGRSDNFISCLRPVLVPIFKGFDQKLDFSLQEKSIIDDMVRDLYENPIQGKTSPVLTDGLAVLANKRLSEGDHPKLQKTLHQALKDFLKTSEGKPFTREDQFELSPVMNCINLEGLSPTLFKFYMGFLVDRIVTHAFVSCQRCQVVLNEYNLLYTKAPELVSWISILMDRKGRKEWAGLTRITQGVEDVIAIDETSEHDTETLSSISHTTLLRREDKHEKLGRHLEMPEEAISVWQKMPAPLVMDKDRYRLAFYKRSTRYTDWQYIKLVFPELLLDIMTTAGADKAIRFAAFKHSQDVFERIAYIRKARIQQQEAEEAAREKAIQEQKKESRCAVSFI